MSETFLSIKNIVKQFGDFVAVDNVSLDIAKGEIFALLGSSGCGKSTLLRILAGFEFPTSGQVLLEGQDLLALPPHKRPLNMMFQSYALFPHLSVWDNIAFGLKRDKTPAAELKQRVEELLELVQLSALAKRKPHQLSGGQSQRVALARSLAKRPRLLLLDEPLGALDKKLRERTQIELVNIVEKVGVTCIMVTHDQEEAMTMAHRMAIMSQGNFLQVGPPREVYETPSCEFVADFVGSVNLFSGRLVVDEPDHVVIATDEAQIYISHGITGTANMALSVAIRPEKMTLSRTPPEGPYNWAKAVVRELSYYGSYTTYHLKLNNGKTIRVTQANQSRHQDNSDSFSWDDTVFVSWSSESPVTLAQ